MPTEKINLIKGDKHGTETDFRDALPVNMSGVIRPMFGAVGYMLQQPGLTQYAAGSGVDRGGIWNERFGSHFRISGTDFIEVSTNGSVDVIASISGTDTVSLPYSFQTQGIVANGNFYLFDPSVGFQQVTDPDLGNPIDCVWVDGFYFFTDGESIYHSELTNESSIDPVDIATSEFSPDPTLGVGKTTDNKVIVFNRYTTEYFVNDASDKFSFARVATRANKVGIVGTHCKVEMLDQWYVMGSRKDEDVSIHILGVGSATEIASREVVKLINQNTEEQLALSVVETRVVNKYHYIIVHLPNETLLYNHEIAQAAGNEMAWSIIKSDVQGDAQWRGKYGVFEATKGVWVYGDKQDSRIGILDETVSTHYGDLAEWVLNTPFMYLDSTSIDELEIQTIPGFNTSPDATVFISFSYNGVTHGMEYTLQYGKPSKYGQRFIARRLGYISYFTSIKLRGASTSRMAFSRAIIDYG